MVLNVSIELRLLLFNTLFAAFTVTHLPQGGQAGALGR